MSGNGKRPYPERATVTAHEPQLSEILAYCRLRAIEPSDPDTNTEHERQTWREIRGKYGNQARGDLLDFLDDHYSAIVAAMYTGTCPPEVSK